MRSDAASVRGVFEEGTSERELLDAARELNRSGVLHASTDGPLNQPLVHLSPAAGLRMAAEQMEREDAAIFRFRRALHALEEVAK